MVKLHASVIWMIYDYIRVTYGGTRVHTNDIRMAYE